MEGKLEGLSSAISPRYIYLLEQIINIREENLENLDKAIALAIDKERRKLALKFQRNIVKLEKL